MTIFRHRDIRSKMTGFALGVSALLAMSVPILDPSVAKAQEEAYQVVKQVSVPGGLGSFDIGFVDSTLHSYFLADRTNAAIDVLDTNDLTLPVNQLGKGDFAGARGGNNDVAGPNGVITVNNTEAQIWVGDGPRFVTDDKGTCSDASVSEFGCSHVVVLTPTGSSPVAEINTGGVGRADELCVDPEDQMVLVANDTSKDLFLTFISTVSPYAILGHIHLDGSDPKGKHINATNGIEQCQWKESTRKFYLAIPEVNGDGNNSKPGAVLSINPKTLSVDQVFNIDYTECVGPQGLTIGPDPQILLGCSGFGAAPYQPTSASAPGTVVIDARNGHTIYNLPTLNGNDEVWYAQATNEYFLAGGNRTTYGPFGGVRSPTLGVVDANNPDQPGNLDQLVVSAIGSHSVAAGLALPNLIPEGTATDEKMTVFVPVNNNTNQGAKTNICGADQFVGCILLLQSTPPANEVVE